MGVMFADDLTTPRQRLYWEVLKDMITIDEWEYACTSALRHETFHKVPLPAVLLTYVAACREGEARRLADASRRQFEETMLIERAERLALEASPEWQAEQEKQRANAEQERADYQAWLDAQPRHVLIALGKINPPQPERWRRLSDDDLTYEPSEPPEVAKARLRSQFRQIMDAEGR